MEFATETREELFYNKAKLLEYERSVGTDFKQGD